MKLHKKDSQGQFVFGSCDFVDRAFCFFRSYLRNLRIAFKLEAGIE